MKKSVRLLSLILIGLLAVIIYINGVQKSLSDLLVGIDPFPRCEVPLSVSSKDNNHNHVSDALDIVQGARQEAERKTIYDASYAAGGFPEEGKGACTDVVWRALKVVGIDLKGLVDEDIKTDPEAYGPTGKDPDPNIDFRRVRNLAVYFSRHSTRLTTEIKPGDPGNLINWQPGDIVIFAPPKEHIAVISDQRRRDGVPLIIHNAGPWAMENDRLLSWPTEIRYHFRVID